MVDSQGCLGSFSSLGIAQPLLLKSSVPILSSEPIYKVVPSVEFSHGAIGNLTSVLSMIYTRRPLFHGEVPQWGVPRCHESWHSQSQAGNPTLVILLPALGPGDACIFTAFSLGTCMHAILSSVTHPTPSPPSLLSLFWSG